MYLTAAAISEEEDPSILRQAGRTTHMEELQHAQLERNWIHCARSKREMRSDRWAIYSDTEEPLRPITTMVVYLGVEKEAADRDTATGGQDDAHGGTPEVTEDA